jgi:amidase
MVGWIREKTGLSEMDAYEFVSQNARAPIVQMVDPQYTVLVRIPKARLPIPSAAAAPARPAPGPR